LTMRVFMNANANIELLYQRFNNVQIVHRFRGNAVKSHRFGELKNFAPFLFALGVDNAVVDSVDLVLGQLGFDFLDRLGAGVMVPFHVRFIRGKHLVRIELYRLAARFRGLLDRFE